MKAYKFELICFDPNGDCDLDDMKYELRNQKYFCSKIHSIQSVEIGEWDDDHPLNNRDKSKYFIQNAEWTNEL
jgi:hypothetical protein